MAQKKIPSQTAFVKEWFIKRPNRDISHEESKSGIENEYFKITKRRFEDVDRSIRKLAQIGFLIKIKKGWYRYDPKLASIRTLEDFSASDKKQILERDGYKCVICGKGKKDGIDLQVDHIKPKDLYYNMLSAIKTKYAVVKQKYENDIYQKLVSSDQEKDNIEQVQLRKYLNDVDDRQFGLGYWTNERNVEKTENGYVYLKEREYTNNPHIRNNQSSINKGVFPLQEFYDEDGNPTELKTSTQWGQAEVKAEGLGKQLKSVWLKGGIMVHCDHFPYTTSDQIKENITGCEYNDGSLLHCKYGFPFPRKEFCTHCDNTKPFTDLEKHNWRFEQNLNNES